MHLRICAMNISFNDLEKNLFLFFPCACVIFTQPKMSHENDAMRCFYLRLYMSRKKFSFFFFSSLSDDDMHSSTQPLANYPIVYICFSLSGIFMVAHAVKHTIFYGFTHVCSQSMAGWIGEILGKKTEEWRRLWYTIFKSHPVILWIRWYSS